MKKLFCLFCILVCGVLGRAQSQGEIVTFPPAPEKGFYWGYALYIPKTINMSKKVPVLLIMTDCGITDTEEQAKQKTLQRLHYELSEYPIADQLGVPLVMPIVPRPEGFYTHALSRAVFVSQEERFKRLDLQVLKMLQDARQQLKQRHIQTQKKFLVTGFSAAGVFAWRWTMLHPEYVLATATGGALYPMLPLEEWNGKKLFYPVGVADLKAYTGKKFNKKAWLKIPIFSTNGEMDRNDTLFYDECFAANVERPILQNILPEKDMFERRAHSFALLKQLAPNVQTHLYPHLGHVPVTEDVIAFLNQYVNPPQPFTPTDTSDRKPEPIHVVRVMRGTDRRIADKDKFWLDKEENYIVLQTRGTSPNWVYNAYGLVDVIHQGERVASPVFSGSMSDGKKSLLFFRLSDEDLKRLSSDKDPTFSVRAVYPEVLEMADKLMFVMR